MKFKVVDLLNYMDKRDIEDICSRCLEIINVIIHEDSQCLGEHVIVKPVQSGFDFSKILEVGIEYEITFKANLDDLATMLRTYDFDFVEVIKDKEIIKITYNKDAYYVNVFTILDISYIRVYTRVKPLIDYDIKELKGIMLLANVNNMYNTSLIYKGLNDLDAFTYYNENFQLESVIIENQSMYVIGGYGLNMALLRSGALPTYTTETENIPSSYNSDSTFDCKFEEVSIQYNMAGLTFTF